MHVTPWHGTNACHSMVWASTCHTIAWHQCMSHYSMVPTCHIMAWYQCMSHYSIIPMHVTLWHGTNTCYTLAWYIPIAT